MGTAADMWIEENMALAARRGQRRGLKWAINKHEREQFKKMLSELVERHTEMEKQLNDRKDA